MSMGTASATAAPSNGSLIRTLPSTALSTDPRSGIVNDPNRPDDPEYIVRLIGQVITVSLETVRLVQELATLTIDQV